MSGASAWLVAAAVLAAVSAAVLALVLVGLALKLKATAAKVEALADRLHTDLLPVLDDCRQAFDGIKEAAPRIKAGIQGVRDLADTVSELGSLSKRATSFFRMHKES